MKKNNNKKFAEKVVVQVFQGVMTIFYLLCALGLIMAAFASIAYFIEHDVRNEGFLVLIIMGCFSATWLHFIIAYECQKGKV